MLSLLIVLLSLQQQGLSQVLSGCVNKEHIVQGSGIVIDGRTVKPVEGATVSIPSKNIYTVTNEYGEFNLGLKEVNPVILSIKKPGYKPFSTVIDKQCLSQPMTVVIVKNSLNELVIDSKLHHLGDNKFSDRSANAGDFSTQAAGTYFIHEFYLDNIDTARSIALKIGSVIGIDTKIAQSLRQSNVRSSCSSPVKVYLNSQKIGEISFNGDNHVFPVPQNLLKANRYNIVKIETGVNLDSDRSVDYDDIEFMNLFLDISRN